MAAVPVKSEIASRSPYALADKLVWAVHHNACKIATRRPRQRRVGKAPKHILHVARVEARSMNLDEQFSITGFGTWNRFHLQIFE
jgi:hypothetical protein